MKYVIVIYYNYIYIYNFSKSSKEDRSSEGAGQDRSSEGTAKLREDYNFHLKIKVPIHVLLCFALLILNKFVLKKCGVL